MGTADRGVDANLSAVHTALVEWMDTDAAGHHHNTAIVRFVEAAEASLMREHGVAGYFGTAPRVRLEVDYEARMYFGQPVTTHVTLERIGTSSMTFRFEVWAEKFDGQARQRAASGRFVTVHVPDASGGAEPWPAPWLDALRRPAGGESLIATAREDGL